MDYSASQSTRTSTYLICSSLLVLIIGVILLVISNNKCTTEPDSSTCKDTKNWGISLTVICAVLCLCVLIMRLKFAL